MKDVLVVGAGKIGGAIALMLADSGAYRVTVADRDPAQLRKIETHPAIRTTALDIGDHAALVTALAGRFAVLSAAPFHLTGRIAAAAREAGVHYLDLTEDVATTRKVEALAEGASSAFIPQCGLAPGFISIVAHDLARRFDTLDSVRMRVGALPQYPSNALNYNLTWSTDGLINEYIEPCEAVVEGRLTTVPALEEREEFSLDGVTYEAFNTSGGLGTLARSLEGRVRTMNYRTIRYPGHQAIIKALVNDFNLRNRREVLKDLFEHALPATMQDVVVIFVTVCGWRDGRYEQETYANKVYAGAVGGRRMSAIQITTAAGITTVLDLLADGRLQARGFVRQEEIDLADVLANRFGRAYDPDAARMLKAS
ncbi:saccharopine dehydrogenase family protein [Aureimonas jatrophae]|uniref:Saccharopine dehydrogenase, NADP-dependent n=1 Tax=Aureimonas jatrophae TaxID=1166073 RepID=A0A1H0KPR0_9HYPH|nr:saccharopine dehydrogenase family protein [Aureimonas jatrophae]MBB3948812.1 saccharopine dehydrogenase-like NADP-dependent oxidoreductase [Aureimonas jatrophae]SDO57845.1 Saccharopine dehydrogenase, NADP-dependent [Aureimonas jatrophae]